MMPWSNEQQRLLRAMGYVLYARAPVRGVAIADAAVATTPMANDGLARLLRALQSAASGADVSWIGDLSALRDDARAKRMLWPKLRALRRAGRTSGAAGSKPKAPDDRSG